MYFIECGTGICNGVIMDEKDRVFIETVAPQSHGFIVNADVLNIRRGPGTSYSIVCKLYQGDYVWLDPEADVVSGWTGIYGTNSKGERVMGMYLLNTSTMYPDKVKIL